MFTRAFKEMDDEDWEQGPSTINPVESLNRQSLQEGDNILHALMENIYLENRLCAVKTAVCKENVTTSYKSSPSKQKLNESAQVKASVVTKVRRISADIY